MLPAVKPCWTYEVCTLSVLPNDFRCRVWSVGCCKCLLVLKDGWEFDKNLWVQAFVRSVVVLVASSCWDKKKTCIQKTYSAGRWNEFVLVGRVRANNLLSMKAECLMAWGPGTHSRAPGGVPGQSPGGGRGGSASGSSWVLAFVKGPERISWKYFFFKSTYICMVQKCLNWIIQLVCTV